jgi:hypothetical protein
MRKNTINESAFDNINEESAYWIGVLIARGTLTYKSKTSHSPTIEFESKYEELVEKYKKFLNSSHKIYSDKRKHVYSLHINSVTIGNKLMQFGMKPKKRYFQGLSPNLILNKHCWRGIVDVHGSFDISTKKSDYYTLKLKSSEKLVLQFKSFIEKSIGKVNVNVEFKIKNYVITIKGSDDVLKIVKLLYEGCSIALNSNLEKAYQMFNSPTIIQSPKTEYKQAESSIEREVRVTEERSYPIINSHESAQYYLLELGNKLNFLTHTPDLSKEFNGKKFGEIASIKQLAPDIDKQEIRNIDVKWCHEDKFPYLCFEIEHSTNFRDALFRFNKLRLYNVRFFFVAAEHSRKDYENLIKDLPMKFEKDRLRFISYDDLAVVYETTLDCYNNINELLGQNLTLVH